MHRTVNFIARAENLKRDFIGKSIGINFFGLNTVLDVTEIPGWDAALS